MNSIKERLRAPTPIYIYIYILFALFSFWLAAQIPYTHDDWDWGLSYGIDQLLNATINSRYAGNTFVVIMTRSPFLKTLIMGLGFFLIPYLLSRFVLYEKACPGPGIQSAVFMAAAVFMFCMPTPVWSQTYGWVSGFANYAISAVFIMFWLHHVNLAFSERTDQKPASTVLFCLLCFVLALIGQLFLENLALYNLLLSITLVVIYKVRKIPTPAQVFSLLLGAVIGLAIMFSSSLYGEFINDVSYTGGIRKLIFSVSSEPLVLIYYSLYQLLMLIQGLSESNTFANIFILISASVLLLRHCREKKSKAALLFIAVNLFYMVYFAVVARGNPLYENYAMYSFIIIILINVFYFVFIGLEIIVLFREKRLLLGKLLLLLCSGPVIIAPLVITLDSGPRLYFTSNIFLYCVALSFLYEILRGGKGRVRGLIGAGLACVFVLCILSFGYRYHEIGKCMRYRDAYIQQSIEEQAESISLPDYPHDELLWMSRPFDYSRLVFFKEFYGIPEGTEVDFIATD